MPYVRTDWDWTWHSLRDRFAVTAVDDWKIPLGALCAAGGWEDQNVVFSRYYGSTSQVLEQLRTAMD